MYLKPERDLYRRRRHLPWGRWLIFLLLVGVGIYEVRTYRTQFTGPPTAVVTPTLAPTPTHSPAVYIADAEDAYWQGNFGKAISAYQHALDMEPNQPELYLTLSRLLTFHGQPERGVEMAREALRRQPENAKAWALLGMAYDWLGVPHEAIAAEEKAIALDPTLPEGYAYLAEAYMDVGDWFDANDVIGTAMELDDTNVDVLRDHGYVLENQGNYYGAIQAYRQALERHPNLAHLYLAIGRNQTALQNLRGARDAYVSATKADPSNVEAWDTLGWTLLLLEDYPKAEKNLKHALEVDKTYGKAYGHLATLYFQQRNYEDAITNFKPAVRYGEAASRRRTVFFVITEEPSQQIGEHPQGREIARAEFIHPLAFDAPLRGVIQGKEGFPSVTGRVRLDVLSGRYEFQISGLPPAQTGQAYVGWFVPLQLPERITVHTSPLFPTPEGTVEVSGDTGPVKGPPIETYYTLALCYYLLDECDQAQSYIQVALRIDPNDANAQQTANLCR